MKVFCPNCQSMITADDLNLNQMIGKCQQCHTVFALDDHVNQLKTSASKKGVNTFDSAWKLESAIEPKKQIHTLEDLGPTPKSIHVEKHGKHMRISRRWFSAKFIFLTIFVMFWDGFLVLWYSIIPSQADAMFIWFPLIHVAVGIGLTYYTLAGYLNKTHLLIDHQNLHIKHAPLPWRGNYVIALKSITQFYCKERIMRSKNGHTRSYSLNYIDEYKRHHEILTGIPKPLEVQYLEQVLEFYLGITNQEVSREFQQ
jgi:predicted Zn finger-like uncharacterized protein